MGIFFYTMISKKINAFITKNKISNSIRYNFPFYYTNQDADKIYI